MDSIKTRVLIVSDTHGLNFSAANRPLQSADVAIHCGDLSDGSKLQEFRKTIQLLKDLDAPLKLAIAGNHDFTMDIPVFKQKVAEASTPLDPALVAKEYGTLGQARQLFNEAQDAGIVFLDEGTHQFRLRNGALLKVYASPFTPSESAGAWGFQYHPKQGHQYSIEEGVDVVVTHGPPQGVMDFSHQWKRAGCNDLFAAVARARPRIHCFGHIHEGWGAKLVAWRKSSGQPTHFTAIDNNKSHLTEKLAGLEPSTFEDADEAEQRSTRVERYARDRCCTTSHCAGDENPLVQGKQTLFVNAALCDGGELAQKPWLVDVELPRDNQ